MSNRAGRQVPKNRGGLRQVSSIPAVDEPSMLEQNAPTFGSPEEYNHWLDGQAKRREVTNDFRRLGNGLALLSSLNGQTDCKIEALIRVLVEKGVLDLAAYKKMVETQLEFKQVLDTVNFLMKDQSMKDKVGLVLQWNEEHPDHYIHAGYLNPIGFVPWLKNNPDGLDFETRYAMAVSTHIEVEKLFTAEELSAYAATQEVTPPVEKGTTDGPEN